MSKLQTTKPKKIIIPKKYRGNIDTLESRLFEGLGNDGTAFFNSLSESERIIAVQILQEMAQADDLGSDTLDHLWMVDYWEKPLGVIEWLENPYYVPADVSATLFPCWREALEEIFAPNSSVIEVVLGGAIGVGKTSAATLMLMYFLYRLACLRNPHKYYSLQQTNAIILGVYSVTKGQANDGIYAKCRGLLEQTQWFQEKFPFNQKMTSKTAFTKHPLELVPGSKAFHVLGRDLICLVSDEVNFAASNSASDSSNAENKSQPKAIYNEAVSRMKSRFLQSSGKNPGMVIMSSSKRSTSSFLEEHIEEAKEDIARGLTKVYEYSQWDAKPATYAKCGRFRVEVGDQIFPSRILKLGEEARHGARVVEVPELLRKEFETDIDKNLRDMAGVATFGLSNLFRNGAVLKDAITPELQHPFTKEEIVLDVEDDRIHAHHYFLPEKLFNIEGSNYVLKNSPTSPRFWHLDLGIKKDSAGFTVSHMAGRKRTERTRPDGTTYAVHVPMIIVDLMIRITPPMGSKTDISKIHEMIVHLRDMGIPLLLGSCDQYQSEYLMQLLEKDGFEVKHLSVSGVNNDDPYIMLQQAFADHRIMMYDYPPVIKELVGLQHDIEKRLVDHAKGEHNDVSDSLCGSVYHCLTDHRASADLREVMPDWKPNHAGRINKSVATVAGSILWGSLDREREAIRRSKKR
jgi:hypothetical protein